MGSACLLHVLTALWIPFGLVLPQDQKLPIPEEALQEKARKEIRELFKADYAKRDAASRRSLAARLLDQGAQSVSDGTSAFVLLFEASSLAAEAGDVKTALAAVDQLREMFVFEGNDKVDPPVKLKADALAKAQRAARAPAEARAVAAGYLAVAREAASAGDFRLAQDAVKKASSIAKKVRDKTLASRATEFGKEIPELRREFDAAARADLSKAIDMGEHRTNLSLGRYLCFVKGDWAKGLEYLQWSGKGGVGEVAKKDLANPSEPDGQFELAEAWWALSDKERNSLHRRRYLIRARTWYEKAEPASEGLLRIKVEKRLTDIEDLVHEGSVNLLRLVDPAKDSVHGTWSFQKRSLSAALSEGSVRVLIPYSPPDEYDLHVVLRRTGSHDAIIFGLLGGGRQWTLRVDSHPVNGYLTGVEMLDGQFQDKHSENVSGRRIEPGRDYTLLVSVRRTGVSLVIDGSAVYEWKGKFDRLSLSPLWPIKDKNAMSAGAWGGGVSFSAFRLTPVSGRGRKLR